MISTSFRRAIAKNVAVQFIGPASSFLTVFVIARRAGPQAQGQYAQLKAWVDFMVALGCFGFPQSFIYVINRFGASAQTLASWSALYSLGYIPVALAGSFLALHFHLLNASLGSTAALAPVLTCAAGLLVLHGLWRGIFLTHRADTSFALFTVLPAVTLFVASCLAMAARWYHFELVILLAAVPAIALSSLMMRPILRRRPIERFRDQPWSELLGNGAHSFIQALLITLQPLIAYRYVRWLGGSNREIGFLNLGLFLIQGLSVPITMVAPLLFAHWTSTADHRLLNRLHSRSLPILLAGLGIGGLLGLIARPGIPFAFGSDYADAVPPVQVMLLIVPLIWQLRVLAPALHARGAPVVNTVACAVRLLVFCAAVPTLSHFRQHPSFLIITASSWVIAELAGAICSFVGLRHVSQTASAP